MNLLYKYVCLLLLLFSFSGKAQVNLDSLWSSWVDSTKKDTNRLKAIYDFTWDGYLSTQPDSAFYFAQLQYDFAKSVNNELWKAKALRLQGLSLSGNKNELENPLEYFQKALTIFKKIEHHGYISKCLLDIAKLYSVENNFQKTIEFRQQALTYEIKKGNNTTVAHLYSHIGDLFNSEGELEAALDYYQKCLVLRKEIGNKNELAISYNTIGNVYLDLGN